jgi:hypothetical protein
VNASGIIFMALGFAVVTLLNALVASEREQREAVERGFMQYEGTLYIVTPAEPNWRPK